MQGLYYYRIPFSEVDAMGIVHHSNHARYFERGRVDHLRLLDLNYLGVTKRGMHFPLIDMSCHFLRPLYFDDIIVVESKIIKLTKLRLQYSYRVFKAEALAEGSLSSTSLPGRALVTGITSHCCVNNEGRPMPMADDLYEGLKPHLFEEST